MARPRRGGGFGRRRDLGGSRGCLYCCRLAPPSVFLTVSAALSRLQSQKWSLGSAVRMATFFLHPASESPTSYLSLGSCPSGPKACAKPYLILLKRENTISRRHLHSLVVLKTILHLLNNSDILYSRMFIMRSTFETLSGKLITVEGT